MRNRARQFVQYHQRVLELDPIAYWPLNEKQGSVAYDWAAENGAQNGAYTGVALLQPGIGDGNSCPSFDGANDFCNIYTAALAAAFDSGEGTATIWARVSGAGVWTDGQRRDAIMLLVDGANYILITKRAGNNLLSWYYVAGGGWRGQREGGDRRQPTG